MTIQWTLEKLTRFKRVYQENKLRETMTFEGMVFYTKHVKYLIEYLETKLNEDNE